MTPAKKEGPAPRRRARREPARHGDHSVAVPPHAFPRAKEGEATPLRYEVTFKRPKKAMGPEDEGGEHTEAGDVARETQVREAIRVAKRNLRTCLPWTQVTVRAFGPGRPAKGRVEYQAHVNDKGKIIVEER